ncbi:hypothetical protein OL229_08240 [Neisseriaceae bacterium JH1-16]|nr:hypothetical protein [Neisseriaceae bacterium JH1-16]
MYAQFFQLSRLVASALGATTVALAASSCIADSGVHHASATRLERVKRLGPTHATVRLPSTPRAGRLQQTALWPDQEIILSASR